MDQNLAAVGRIGLAFDESARFQAVHQLNSGVVPQSETVRQLADRGMSRGGKTLESEQGLMLLRLDSMTPGLHLAEMQKLPELIPKLGELLIFV